MCVYVGCWGLLLKTARKRGCKSEALIYIYIYWYIYIYIHICGPAIAIPSKLPIVIPVHIGRLPALVKNQCSDHSAVEISRFCFNHPLGWFLGENARISDGFQMAFTRCISIDCGFWWVYEVGMISISIWSLSNSSNLPCPVWRGASVWNGLLQDFWWSCPEPIFKMVTRHKVDLSTFSANIYILCIYKCMYIYIYYHYYHYHLVIMFIFYYD